MSTTSVIHNLCNIASSSSIPPNVKIDLFDESHGLYGELISSDIVRLALVRLRDVHENVGKIDDPSNAQIVTTLHSLSYTPSEMILLEIDNASLDYKIKVQYLDSRGNTSPSQLRTIAPLSTMVQYSQSGNMYILTAIQQTTTAVTTHGDTENNKENEDHQNKMECEIILGAYRPIRSLPSNSPHCILVEQKQHLVVNEDYSYFTKLLVENMLMDDSKQDSLVVAAANLENGERPLPHDQKQRTLSILQTILQNLIDHPNEDKYRKLRLSNRSILQNICPFWGAMHMLHVLGFRKTKSTTTVVGAHEGNRGEGEEDYLVYPTIDDYDHDLFQRAKHILELLERRNDPHFVAELDPSPPPWYRPVLAAAPGTDHRGDLSSHWNTHGTHFITPEERWERIERVQQWKHRGRRGWT